MHKITESQRLDLMEALNWARFALDEEMRRENGKPWVEHLQAEASAFGFLWDALDKMAEEVYPEPPTYQECGGCGRINDSGDDVCLCDMERFRKERPDEYADMVADGIIEPTR